MRKLLIAANWKMYKTPAEAQTFLHPFLPLVKDLTHSEIAVKTGEPLGTIKTRIRSALEVLRRSVTGN